MTPGADEEDLLGAIMGGAGPQGPGAPPGPSAGPMASPEMPAEGPPPEGEAEAEERPDPMMVLGDLEAAVEQMKMALG